MSIHILRSSGWHTATLIVVEGQFQVFQRLSSSVLVLKTVESRFMALNYQYVQMGQVQELAPRVGVKERKRQLHVRIMLLVCIHACACH